MGPEITAAIIAGLISIVGIGINVWWSQKNVKEELKFHQEEWQANLLSKERQWQESFRAELRRDLVRESTLEILKGRLICYGNVWGTLKITSGHNIKHSTDLKKDIQLLANELTNFAYSQTGLLMTDRSRRLLNHLRVGCGSFLKDEIEIQEIQNRAHLLKHSMRSDVGIENLEYESEINSIAKRLGRVDDWRS
ncbi:MAG TPA: hypothetical protein PLD25_24190 [Chloroflexota bacterium]|nr:hypothetical protein [Chloroflexota bacterium]